MPAQLDNIICVCVTNYVVEPRTVRWPRAGILGPVTLARAAQAQSPVPRPTPSPDGRVRGGDGGIGGSGGQSDTSAGSGGGGGGSSFVDPSGASNLLRQSRSPRLPGWSLT